MSGSGASNLGYENENPYNMSSYVNGTSSSYSGNFSSNQIPGTPPGPLPGLAGAKSNVDAAAGIVPGITMNGGAKKLKRKIKNITKHYKRMKAGSRKIKSIRNRLRHKSMSKSLSGGKRRTRRHSRRHHRRQRGGYSQYMSNVPNTPTYQVAGVNLPYSRLAEANPPPITTLNRCVNCVDNFSKFSMNGFPSKGN
jgi:hypothetical protein